MHKNDKIEIIFKLVHNIQAYSSKLQLHTDDNSLMIPPNKLYDSYFKSF